MNEALLERDAELGALVSALDGAVAGSGSVVLVSGEAGIGKTSLVRAFTAAARGRTRVLLGACDDLVTPRTLGPLRDAVRTEDGPLARALADVDRDAILTGVRAELADPSRPTVLVVEDVHWADEATLDVLRYLGRRIAELPSLLVLTFRDEEVGGPLQRVLGSFGGGSAHRLALARLSRAAVSRWAGGTTITSADLYRMTNGNPFHVSEVLATFVPGGSIDVPATVADAVLARIRLLDDAVQAVLDLFSVVPGEVGLGLARELVGDLELLADAERAGVLEVRPDAVAFRHELARRAVEGSLPTIRRMALHARVLEVLLARPDTDLTRLVHHAVAAGDDAAVVRYGPAAAREAARVGAHVQEVALYEEVLLRRGALADTDRAAMLEACAMAHFYLDHPAMALVTAEAAVRLRETLGDPAALGGALVPLGPVLWTLARPQEALDAARRSVTLLEPGGDGPVLGWALAYAALGHALLDHYDDALAYAERLLGVADRLGDLGLTAVGHIARGLTRTSTGDEDGLTEILDARAPAEQAGQHVYVLQSYTLAVQCLWDLGRIDDLVAVADEGLVRARARDLDLYEDHLVAHGHRCRAVRGEWAAAEDGLRALIGDPDGGEVASTRYSLPDLARLLVRTGGDDVDEILAWAEDYAHRTDSRYELVPTLLAVIEHGWAAGDLERARAAARCLDERTARPGPVRHRAELLRWCRRLGRDVSSFDGCPEPFAAGLRGDWRAAAAGWQERAAPYEQALELADSGDVDATLEALAILDRLGATPAATLVRRRLRALGVRVIPRGPAPATRSNPAGLTDRQLAILRELTAGRTNAEIADALVLSIRTVDHHVSAVLAKLGVAGRREAVAEASRLGIG